MGKTGLIHHILGKLPAGIIGIYMDIQPAENRLDFLNLLVSALARALPEESKFGKKAWELIRSLRPVVSFDPLTGHPQVTIDARSRQPDRDIEVTLAFLSKQSVQVILAIDEFQQILNFPERHTDAWLRSQLQQLPNITFLFSGSQQHVMGDLFNNPSRPFYRSTVFHRIGAIPDTAWLPFIVRNFNQGGKTISESLVADMLAWSQNYTYYVQLLCNRVFASGHQTITRDIWQAEGVKMIGETEPVFYSYRDLLPANQWMLLKALAAEHRVFAPTAQEFLSAHALAGSASVLQALQALLKKEMIYRDYDASGKPFYSVYDLLFERWIESRLVGTDIFRRKTASGKLPPFK